jgi:hypothetical protein
MSNRNPKTLVLPEFSNREDLYLPFGVFDDDTGDPVDMTALGWTFQFEIRRMPPRGSGRAWVGPWYDDDDTCTPLIILALGTGPDFVNVVDVGQGLIWVSETNMRKLRHRTYQAALVGSDGTRSFQIFNATLPIDFGGVTN